MLIIYMIIFSVLFCIPYWAMSYLFNLNYPFFVGYFSGMGTVIGYAFYHYIQKKKAGEYDKN